MTDREKARALWWQEVQHRFHFEGDNDELLDPVKVFNVYGYNTCGNDSICLAGLWRKAGLKVAPARLVGHCVTQVFYDGSWHLMDGDMHSIYLLRDNETVAGEQDLVRDHDLIRRTHTQGILQPDRRAGDEWESSIYVFEGSVNGDRNSASTALNMTLRPGEAIVWRWGHLNPIKYHGPRPPRFPDRLCNGLWEYRPDFQQPSWRAGATTVESIREGDDGLDGGGREDRRRRLDDVQPLRLCRGKAGGRGDRREVQALLGWQVLARGRSQSRRALPARGARSVPVLPEMRAVGRRTAPPAGDRQRPPDGPAHSSRYGCRHERVHLHRRDRRAGAGCGSPTSGSSGPRADRPTRRPNRSFLPPEE